MKPGKATACWWFFLVWLSGGFAAAAEPVVELPAFHVSESLAHVVVSPFYERGRREADGRVLHLVVQDVRAGSLAAKAGLARGMEIHALQGVPLQGLTDAEVRDVMARPVTGDFVLRVKRPLGFRPFDLVIPLPRPGPAASR